MEFFDHLAVGFSIAFSPINLLFVFLGVVAGTLIGALPGIGPVAGIAILLLLSFGMNPTTAMILMCGIYYGCMYGGTITSVLMSGEIILAIQGSQNQLISGASSSRNNGYEK